MPVIKITQDMIDRSKSPEKGWSHGKLVSVNESPSEKKDSINYFYEFQLDQGPEKKDTNKGRFATTFFNSKALGQHEGNKGMSDVIESFLRMVAALQGVKRSHLNADEIEQDALIGKECYLHLELKPHWKTQQMQVTITDFSADIDIPF